jgi:hypothetical protein
MREPHRWIPEAHWKMDAEVEAARARAGWAEFHKACAKQQLFFDHIEKHGRQYVAAAVHGSGAAYKVAEERAKTPIDALAAAYRAGGVRVPDAEPWLEMIISGVPDFDDLLGGDAEPELEDILG